MDCVFERTQARLQRRCRVPSASTARRDRKPKRCKSRPQDDIGGALRNRGKTNAVKHWLHKTMSGAPRKRDETNAIRKRGKTHATRKRGKHWLHKTMSGDFHKRGKANANRKRGKTRPQHDVGAALRERSKTSPTHVPAC